MPPPVGSEVFLRGVKRPGPEANHSIHLVQRVKGKSVPFQAWNGPEGSRKLRFPDYVTTEQDGGKVVSRTHRRHLPPKNAP